MGKRVGNIIFLSLLLCFFSSAIPAADQAAASEGQRYAIEVGLYLQKRSAEQMVSDLAGKGYEPYLFEKTENDRHFYLVFLGSYSSREEAERAASDFAAKENLPAVAVVLDAPQAAAPAGDGRTEADSEPPDAGDVSAAGIAADPPLQAGTLKEITLTGGNDTRGEIESMIDGWLSAWSSQDIGEYGQYYAEGFASRGMNREEWLRYKESLNERYDSIQVEADELVIYPGEEKSVAKFRQHYTSSAYQETGYKQLILTRQDGRWKIYREIWSEADTFDLPPGFTPLSDPPAAAAAGEEAPSEPAPVADVEAVSPAPETGPLQFSVQVGSFLKQSVAEQVAAELEQKGYTPYVMQLTDFNGNTYFAVRLEDFVSREEAAQAAVRFAEQEGLQATVVPFDALETRAADKPEPEPLPVVEMVADPVVADEPEPSPAVEDASPVVSEIAAEAAPKLYAVQLIPYASRTEAEAMSSELASKGYEPYIFESNQAPGKAVYAVRIGDYEDQEAALSALTDFKQSERMPAFITGIDAITAVKLDAAVARRAMPAAPVTPPQEAAPRASQPSPATPRAPVLLKDENGEIVAADDIVSQLEILKAEVEKIQGESEVRRKLMMTEEEESAEAEEILEAAGREYTLMPKGTLGLEYKLTYSYNSYDIIRTEEEKLESVDHQYNHSLTNSIITEYAFLDNLTAYLDLPFVYRYYKVGTDNSLDETNLGDIALGLQWQPFKSGPEFPTTILSARLSLPTGESPFEIVPDDELSTGSGFYSASAGLYLSKVYDPIFTFGSLNYTHNFDADDLDQNRVSGLLEKFDPGDEISTSLGFGFALSYNVSLTMSYQYTFNFEDEFVFANAENIETEARASSMLFLGTSWRFSPQYSVFFTVGLGLTTEDPDFTFSFRLPYEF